MSDEETTEVQAQETAPETTEQPAEKTFTQSDLDKIVSERIARERSKFEGFDDYKARAEAAGDLTQKLSAETERADKAELSALRTSVASEHGVPLTALTATTEEELTAQAKSLLEWRGTPTPAKRESNTSGNTNSDSGMNAKERAVEALKGSWRG